MSAVLKASDHAAPLPDPVRVVVVDDSAVVRGLLSRWLAEESDIQLVASLSNGREAVDWIARNEADVVVLDIDMPEMDGLAALPLLLARRRDLVVIMASTLTRRNAEISFKALSLGAADYVAKPEANRGITTTSFRRELTDKIRLVGHRRARFPRWRPPALRAAGHVAAARGVTAGSGAINLRPASAKPPRVVLIGASTGGPQALISLLPQLDAIANRIPVLIVQHMPPTFTTLLAEHITQATGRPTHEGVDGEPVVPGTIYIAPGGRHMRVACRAARPIISLDDSLPINFCRPAVDPLFKSASEVWGERSLAIILTGMGCDGTAGARAIAEAGGTIIAQDEATSAVWGMPGSAAQAGVCSAVLPLGRIAPEVTRLLTGGAT